MPVAAIGIMYATADEAEAATISLSNDTRARVRDWEPTNNNCVRYSPRDSASSSEWVEYPDEAWGAHGASNGNCPGFTEDADLDEQSAIGFQPSNVTSITTGDTFNIGRMQHSNNPLNISTANNEAVLEIEFNGVSLSYPFTLWETSNSGTCPNGSTTKCDDRVQFSSLVDNTTFTENGITYTLVIEGFDTPNPDNSCPTTPTNTSQNVFWTEERKDTFGCLYGTVEQVRPVTVVKQLETPYGITPQSAPNFSYTSNSNLPGSPWVDNFSLDPLSSTDNSVTRGFVTGQSVAVSETEPTDPWNFKSLECVDGLGDPLPNNPVSGRTFTLNESTAPAVEDAQRAPITCTYVNKYEPTAILTLVKDVDTTGQPAPVATAADWTLKAERSGSPATAISGTSGSGAVTTVKVPAGTYALSETATGSNTGGYSQDGPWECTDGTVNGSSVTLERDDEAVCKVKNKFETGQLLLTKTVTGDGYNGGTSKDFEVNYTCNAPAPDTRQITGTATINPAANNGDPGAVTTIDNIPAGYSCVVSETAPSGGLVNTSWTWGTPTVNYTPSDGVVPAGGELKANVVNPTSQNTGSVKIVKAIEPRQGVAPGYTGGSNRAFDYSYECVIGGNSVGSGFGTFSQSSPIVISNVPATATCTVTETSQTTEGGDFADASYVWDGNSGEVSVDVTSGEQATGTITNYYTRKMAELTVTKELAGSGYTGSGTPFEVIVSCGSGSTAVTHTLNLAPSGSGSSETVQVPAGVACTVVETTPLDENLLSAQYSWGDPTYNGLTDGYVSVPAGESKAVDVINHTTIDKGRISVTKAIENYGDVVANGTEFDAKVSCEGMDDQQITLTWSGGASDTWTSDLMPVGTSCTVTEADPSGGLPDASYAWAATPAAQSVTVADGTEPTLVTITNDIVRVKKPLTITKIVQKPQGAPTTGSFSGTYSCVYGNDSPVTGTWTAPAGGGAATLSPAQQFLVGSECTITETTPDQPTDTSYVWTVEVPGPTTIGGDGGKAEVKNILNRNVGSFTIAKSVEGGEPGVAFPNGTEFSFTYSCVDASNQTYEGTVSVPVGGSVAIPDIPGGSSCEVTENADPNATDPYRWDGVTFSGAGGSQDGRSYTFTTPTEGTQVNVSALNTLSERFGSVTVSKTVTGETAGFNGGDSKMFPITLTCDGVNYGTKPVANGGGATFENIPLGATCVATEEGFSGGLANGSFTWGDPEIGDPVKVTTEDGPSGTIEVKNPIKRAYATVQLTKQVEVGSYTGVVDPQATFEGGWSCTYSGPGGDETESGTWSGTDPVTTDGQGTIATLTGTANVLVGSVCTPTETDLPDPSTDPSYSWQEPELTPVTVTGDGVATMKVVNTLKRDTGTVVVKKVLTGETDGVSDGTVFPINASCTYPNVQGERTASVSVAAGQDAVTLISGVPAGWTCVVSESSPTNPNGPTLVDGSYRWNGTTVTINGTETRSVEITSGETQTVEVTNDIERVTGTFNIVKYLAQGTPSVSGDAEFSGAYECSVDGSTVTGTWTVSGTGEATLDPAGPFPVGSKCKVTSEDPVGPNEFLPDTSWQWADPDLGTEITIYEGDSDPAEIMVTNTAKRVYTDLNLTKKFTGDENALVADANVTGSWSCYYPSDSDTMVGSGTWELPALGGTAVLATADADDEGANIPAESRCEISEDTLLQSSLVDESYAWTSPVYEPASDAGDSAEVTTVAGETATATVTNSTERVYGSFDILKNVVLEPAAASAVLDNQTYEGTWRCELPGSEPQTGTWGPISDGDRISIPDIYRGSVCTITDETRNATPVSNDNSFVWLDWNQYPDSGVTIHPEEPDLIMVNNPVDRVLGSFGVTKTVTGAVAGYSAGSTFDFEWGCIAQNGDKFPASGMGTFSLADGETWDSPADIPEGSSCGVREATLATPVHPAFSWDTSSVVSINGTDGPVDEGKTASFITGNDDQVTLVKFRNNLTLTPGEYDVVKTSDPPSGSTVLPGQVVNYTLTVTPIGVGFVDDVIISDNVRELLEHASVESASFNTSSGLATLDGEQILWRIPRVDSEVGALRFKYAVQVDDDAFGVTIRNVVTNEECLEGECTTTHETPAWELSKSSDPASGTTVNQGDVVTYTLTATNTSQAVVENAKAVDDLSDVLDNATLVGDLPPELSLAGDQLTWSIPTINAGDDPATVTYQVKVNDDAVSAKLGNVVTPDTPGGECVEGECSTEHPIPGWTLSKSSDPESGSTAARGSTITYTLTATNTSEAEVAGAIANDDLSKVLNYGELVGELADGLTLDGQTLKWAVPTMAAGAEPVTVSYSVKLGMTEGVVVKNVVVPEGSGGSCEPDTCETEHEVPKILLPKTGTTTGLGGIVPGLVLGGPAVLTDRRRYGRWA